MAAVPDQRSTPPSPAGIVYVAGSGRSGSTLLDVLLNGHPDIVGLGEVHRLSLDPEHLACGDGHPVNKSPFWHEVIAAVCDRMGVDQEHWSDALPTVADSGHGWSARVLDGLLLAETLPGGRALTGAEPLASYLTRVRNSLLFIDEAARCEGASWAIDSGKNPGRLRGLAIVRPDLRVVYLVRDGRAIAVSNRRREGTPVEVSARRLRAQDLKVRAAMHGIPEQHRLVVRFEDLCEEPERELTRICELLGLPFAREMVAPPPERRFQIPGNEWLVDLAGRPVTIRGHDEWRSSWTDRDETAFAPAASVQARYGYRADGTGSVVSPAVTTTSPTTARPPTTKRVNLGCGLNAVDGWLNLDRSPSIVLQRLRPLRSLLVKVGVLSAAHEAEWPESVQRHDVLTGVPLPDGGAEAIYSSHMLEHLFFDQAQRVLVDCRRALTRGGVLRLALPDAEAMAQAFVERGGTDWEVALEFNRELNAFPLVHPSRRQLPARLLGSSGAHKWQPTPALVEHMLREAGFDEVRRCAFREGTLPDLDLVEHREASFFLEAR